MNIFLCVFSLLPVFLVFSCYSLPRSGKAHMIRLYSRGIDQSELATLKLRYEYNREDISENTFMARLFTVAKPIEKIEVPLKNAERYAGSSFLKIHVPIPESRFEGDWIYRFQSRKPLPGSSDLRPYDSGVGRSRRLGERLLLISEPDTQGNVLSVEFYLFPSRKGYMLRVDLRPKADFSRRIPLGMAADRVADILGDSEAAALFHNQTIVGKAR